MRYDIRAVNFIGTLMANVDNDKLSDADFRGLFRNTISIVEKPEHRTIANAEVAARVARYYPANEVGLDARMVLMRQELDEYFKGTEIARYDVLEIQGNRVILVPLSPEYDEDYQNDAMDMRIETIGKKYDLEVRWHPGIRPK